MKETTRLLWFGAGFDVQLCAKSVDSEKGTSQSKDEIHNSFIFTLSLEREAILKKL
jgi:hypothetical protein